MQCTDEGIANRGVPINFRHMKTQCDTLLKIVNSNNTVVEKKNDGCIKFRLNELYFQKRIHSHLSNIIKHCKHF